MKRYLAVFTMVFAVLWAQACSSTPTSRSFNEQWNDSMITSRVKWKMGRDKDVSASNIDVQVWRGVVTMIGHVNSMEEKAKAEEVAMGVQGVTSVKNYIEVVGIDNATAVAGKSAKKGESANIASAKKTKKEEDKKFTKKPVDEKKIEEVAIEEPVKAAPVKKEPPKAVASKKIEPKKAEPKKIETKQAMKEDLFEEPVAGKRQNGVSYEIGKEFAKSGVDTEMPPDDITKEAEAELKALKSRKGN